MAKKSGKVTAKQPAALPSAWRLTRTAALTLWQHRRLFGGIALVYGLLSLLLVQGPPNTGEVSNLRGGLHQIFHNDWSSLGASLASFAALIDGASSNTTNQTGASYQPFLGIIVSLAIIWALRQVSAGKGKGLRIRDAYYRGMSPLIPFILVALMICLQALPALISALLYATVSGNGIAVHLVEKLIWGLLAAALALLSLYLISSSLFALYIVTLPDMTPLKALRSARQLVQGRRWLALRKILFLPLALAIGAAIVMLPIVVWLTPLAPWVFLALSILLLPAVHAYLYTLYRELLNE